MAATPISQLILPAINGEVGFGIAHASEAGIDEVDMLQFSTSDLRPPGGVTATHVENMAKCAAARAYQISQRVCPNMISYQKIMVNAAVAAVRYGLIATEGADLTPTSGWLAVQDAYPNDYVDRMDNNMGRMGEWITKDEQVRALTVLMGTKVNFFAVNHHTGQSFSMLVGYIAKVANALSLWEQQNPAAQVKAIHIIGKWACTISCPRILGIQNLRQVNVVNPIAPAIVMAEDVRLRATGFPAGMAPAAVVMAAAEKLANDRLMFLYPELASLKDLVAQVKAIRGQGAQDLRAYYHVGAAFLTGSERRIIDVGPHIALMGSMIVARLGKTTLAKSPHITKIMQRQTEYVYKNKDGYDADFDLVCQSVRGVRVTLGGRTRKFLSSAGSSGLVAEEVWVAFRQVLGADNATMHSAYAEAIAAFESEEADDDDAPDAAEREL